MTLPASGLISIGAIKTEFGISEGGGFCDKNTLRELGSCQELGNVTPGSPRSLSNFHGMTALALQNVGNISFTDYGTYFQTPDYNTAIGGSDYRFHFVRQWKDAAVWYRNFTVQFSRPTGATFTMIMRRFRIPGIADIFGNSDVGFNAQLQTYNGRVGKYFYTATNTGFWSGEGVGQVVAGNTYSLSMYLYNFN
jgi:hypothetical protein